MQMAKGSYEYAAAALVRPGSAERAESRAAVVKAFDGSGGTHGYRRIVAQTGAGGWTVRTIMDREGLVARGEEGAPATAPTRGRHPRRRTTCCATGAGSTTSGPGGRASSG